MIALGIDSGTQSTKTVAVDLEDGTLLAVAKSEYGMLGGLPEGHLEQEPEWWWGAVVETVGECLSRLGGRAREVGAIGVSGQQHGLVALDAEGFPVRPAKLWCDTSTVAQCEAIEREFGGVEGMVGLAGNPVLPGYTAPKILWLKQEEPEHFESTRTILLPHDFLNFRLTGRATMECGDASGTALLDVRRRTWCGAILDFIDPRLADMLPPLQSSGEPAGELRPELALEWGLPDGVVVGSGGGDNMMGAIGTGNVRTGAVTASLGTSGTLYAFADDPVVDPRGEVAAFCDSTGHWLPLVCTMNVTVATERARQLFDWSLDRLEDAVGTVSAGSDGLVFLPYLNGERTPNLPGGSAVFHGLNARNMTPAHMARAAMEGAMLGLGYGMKRFRELGVEPGEVRLTGGGANSAAWRQMAADVFRVETVALATHEGAALGAAMQAGWCALLRGDASFSLEVMTDRLVRTAESTRSFPDPGAVDVYAGLAERFQGLTESLHGGGYL